MDCTEFLHRYSDYDDSLLTRTEEARFRAHLEGCAACARYDLVLRKGRMLARQVTTPASPDFIPRLEDRLIMDPAPRPVSPGPLAAGGFLTLALVAVAGVWLMDASRPAFLRTQAAAAVHFHDADPSDRPLRLPVLAAADRGGSTGMRVDRWVAPSYSPLVTGPPAYRADRSANPTASATRSTLD